MAYLTDANNVDSDSDDLPAVNIVLQGNGTAQNEDLMRVIGGSSDRDARNIKIKSYRLDTRARGGISRIQKNGKKEMRDKCNLGVNEKSEDTHSDSLEGKKARRFRRVILDESDDQDHKEPEVEKDGENAEVPLLKTRSMLNRDGHYTQKREMTKIECDTSKIAPLSRIWKITHASRYSDSDEETSLESEGSLEARFANIRPLCDRSSSNKNREGDRFSFGSNAIGVEVGVKQIVRPVTPEQNPLIHGDKSHNEQPEAESRTESRLISPSKRKQQQQQRPRIPSTPEYCESSENFWRQSFINEWNDLYSPKKKMLSPKKFPSDKQHDSLKLPDFGNNGQEKNSLVAKPDKEAVRRKKLFRATKHKTAETFLAEVDREVTGGRIAELSRTTGGVKLIWSKKLVSTAGRAHWKRIKSKTGKSSDDFGASEQHYASIELAEKVIDNEDRLKNVIAHEFCHLANFMISDVKDNPHGRSFKEWARKCSKKLAHHDVEVTTRHSYDIDYKYVWQCLSCNTLFKRHSKSIDPKKQACGSCTSRLVQIKPTPRNRNQTDYQLFVKSQFQIVKIENPKASHASIMQILSSRYREEQEITASTKPDPVTLEILNGKLRDLTV